MGSDQRPETGGVGHLDRLASNPGRFHLFHALRVLEAHHADTSRMGKSRRPSEDPVRLGQLPEMAFPKSTIASFEPQEQGKPARLMNLFFGLFGPHGPLPLHITSYARDRFRNHRDRTMLDFSNIFTHRMLGLFYRAWASAEPAPSFDRAESDEFSDRVAALAGYMGEALTERDAMPDLAKRFYAAHLSNGTRHGDGLSGLLSGYFQSDVSVKQFVGEWMTLEPSDCWRLQPASRRRHRGLGRSYHLGTRVWSRASKFGLRIGPMNLDEYTSLLPGGPRFAQLVAIVRNYAGNAMSFDVVLVLAKDEVPEPTLGGEVRLGYNMWIGQRPKMEDADDLVVAGL
ncbi:type VI secretion system baseplate subunit TssG [Tropicimonas sp. S265A]|uniref:type VI secretion system baseplate subunit TssG n=1 Tax=Tropicimonas sp. S265A TaxID=3415134 RepID=UPI003C7DB25C